MRSSMDGGTTFVSVAGMPSAQQRGEKSKAGSGELRQARWSWMQAALAQERAEAAEEQLFENEDIGAPEHVVWIPPRSRGEQPIVASGARIPANLTVRASSDYSGSGSTVLSSSLSTPNESGNGFKVGAKVPGTVNEHKVWDDVDDQEEENPDGKAGSCSDEEANLGPPPSVGSKGHALGECRPCSFFSHVKNGCRFGAECKFCHYSHARAPKLSKKRRAHYEKFMLSKKEQLRANPDAVKEIETSLPSGVQTRPRLKFKCLSRLESYAHTVREEQHGPATLAPQRHVVAL